MVLLIVKYYLNLERYRIEVIARLASPIIYLITRLELY
jgi:hypothetical protein